MYLVYGVDSFFVEREISRIIKEFSNEETELISYDLDVSSIDQVMEEVSYGSLFGNKKIIVVKNSFIFTASTKKTTIVHNTELLERFFQNPSSDVVLIFSVVYEKIDVRKKIVKLFKEIGKIIEVRSSTSLHSLLKELLVDYQMEPKAIEALLKAVGNYPALLQNEVEKLKLYKKDSKIITEEDVLLLTSPYVEPDLFEFVNCLLLKQKSLALSIYHELLKRNEEPIKILVILANQIRLLYQVKELTKKGFSEGDIANLLEAHPYSVKLAKEKSRGYESEQLLSYLSELADLDIRMKLGKTDKDFGLELFILNS